MDSFVGGAAAGLAVDLSLYPLDTVKTRMQSKAGFWKSGGFNGIYNGLSVVTIGSVPGGALFFFAYDTTKKYVPATASGQLLASAVAECTACLVRVPTEMVKQRMQANKQNTLMGTARGIIADGGIMHMYSGYSVTIAREVPFAAIQMPLYEFLKSKAPESAIAYAMCGSVAGGIAAAATTPLDVAKTRIMLGQAEGNSFIKTMATIARNEGAGALFKGVGPRVMWITIGGSVFFGTYEAVKARTAQMLH